MGDHLRKARFDQGLLQRDVAAQIGVHVDTLSDWELGRTEPAIRHWPSIIGFLGHVPVPRPDSFAQKLTTYRKLTGTTREELARFVGADPATVWRWESSESAPRGSSLDRASAVLEPILTPCRWT